MFGELVKKTRSYRNFQTDERISAETLRELIELCRYTPSTANLQSLKFAYACTEDMCEKIFPLLGWAGYLTENKPPYDGNVPAAYILVCGDTDISANIIDIDAGICAQTIVLGAMEKGIGACMLGSFKKDEISGIFGLAENIKPRLVIALGKPKEKIVIVDETDGNIKYYRDEEKTHFVPKRPLDEILLSGDA